MANDAERYRNTGFQSASTGGDDERAQSARNAPANAGLKAVRFSDPRLEKLRSQLRLTWLGLLSEQVVRAFWPLGSVIMLALAALMLGLHELLVVELVWTGVVLSILLGAATAVRGIRVFTVPSATDAIVRLDSTLSGNPIATVLDQQSIGADNPDSQALWQLHQRRMQARAERASAPAPDLALRRLDRFGLRYMALLLLAAGLSFGSIWRLSTLPEIAPGAAIAATGPSWEGWLEPPQYTGLPVLYLNDQAGAELSVPVGSQITLRFYGEIGDLTLNETVSGRTADVPSAADPEQTLEVSQAGTLSIDGPGGRAWDVTVIDDAAPSVRITSDPTLQPDDTTAFFYAAQDDYAIVAGSVAIRLDDAALIRRHGLAVDPDPRAPIEMDLPLPLTGDRNDFEEQVIEAFAKHPWAHLPVVLQVTVEDAAGQAAVSDPLETTLVTRRFFEPLAAAVIEQRRDLLWARANAPRVAQILRTLSTYPAEVFRDRGDYLRLRTVLRRLERSIANDSLDAALQEEFAEALWELAIHLEEGDVGDALARLQRAQEQLSQAMRDGASEEDIARLMQQLRDATQDYLRQLQRQAQRDGQTSDQPQGQTGETDSMTLSQQDLQSMMDRIQELMEQGRMAEAEQALREFQQMMENMQVTEGQSGEGGENGQQSLEELADTLREQQGLSDQAFRDLQEQFNPNANRGESSSNEGRNGGQGRGQAHEGGQGNQGGQGDRPGQGASEGPSQPGDGGQSGQSAPGESGGTPRGGSEGQPGDQQPGGGIGSLADRQENLRNQLRRQQQGLPPLGGGSGEAARDALDQAGRAMEGAEDALRQGDLAGAIDQQSEAMESLREGMRALGEAMAQQQQPGQQQGEGRASRSAQGNQRDPLGRRNGEQGDGGVSDGAFSEGQAYRRAWDLLEEIRRRAGERDRSDTERSYLERLLDRF
ncbi:DUF4175 domain-containing protein [Phaeobacter sp.]|uniref:DUF4175 domain-containing protein n=1 Tax=Phaeobacter sp. TaxID=1902409 RepID=UPI0025F9F625|nr:DUF4175 domain-containing protein [Phaeobacter sp.]